MKHYAISQSPTSLAQVDSLLECTIQIAEKQALQIVGDGTMITSQGSISSCGVVKKTQQGIVKSSWVALNMTQVWS